MNPKLAACSQMLLTKSIKYISKITIIERPVAHEASFPKAEKHTAIALIKAKSKKLFTTKYSTQKLMEVLKLKKIIERTLNENKAINIITISLKGKTSIADYMIIASGNSSRHIQSLAEILVKKLEEKGFEQCKIEGKTSKDWKLIDAIDIIVHIFHPEKESFMI